MDLFETIARRYSARAYHEKPVDDAVLQTILRAANDAPSAGNLQAYEIVVVRDADRKRQLARASLDQMFIAQAPVALVFCANPDRNQEKYGGRGADLYSVQDATVACAYTQLAATALGLATCWVGAFKEGAIRKIISAPGAWRPVAILPVGHATDSPRPHERRPLCDITHEIPTR